MQWTKDVPTKPGPYWYRQEDGDTFLVELSEYEGKLETDTSSTVDEIIEWWGIVAWYGPLLPPEYDL